MLPKISLVGGSGLEYSGGVGFVVTLSEPSLQAVTVSYRTVADGSAIDGLDYYGETGTLTFAPGETQKTVFIDHRAQSDDEFDENYTLELFSATNAVMSGGEPTLRATGVIFDQNGSASDLALFVSDPEIVEGNSGSKKAVFELRLSEPSASDITLSYTTANGTAKAGQDYVAKSGTVTFLAGQTVAAVEVNVLGDTNIETNETFSLVVTPNGFIQNGTQDSTGIATILTDEKDGDKNDNVIKGTPFADALFGRGGNDKLSGLGADDILFGGTGNDILRGGTGNDILRGEEGDDSLFGDQGSDKLAGGRGNDRLNGGNGEDEMDGGAGVDTVDYGTASSAVFVSLAKTTAQQTGGGGTDTLSNIENARGSDFADTIRGTAGNNLLDGGKAGDRLIGLDGNDTLLGQAGGDDISGGGGSDRLVGGGGNDTLKGDGQADVVLGNSGNDRIAGGGGADDLRGGDGKDVISGNKGNDRIDGGKGSDMLTGNGGIDTFVFARVSGQDRITDFQAAREKIDLSIHKSLNSFSDVLAAATDIAGVGVEIKLHKAGAVIIEDVFLAELTADTFIF